MKALSVKQIRRIEEAAKKIGLTERILIENASSNLTAVVDSLNLGKKACVIAGKGNNGADALASARKLAARNYKVNAVILEEKEFNKEVRFQKELLEKLNIPVSIIKPGDIDEADAYLKNCDFILDGILGIGLKGEISGFFERIIKKINKSGKKIVSCDIPSGLSPDDGAVLVDAIKADYTITFIAPKKGFFLKIGKELCGKIYVTDIGAPELLLNRLKK